MSKARDSVEFLNSPDDREVWRSSRAIIGYDDDSDITNNRTANHAIRLAQRAKNDGS